MIHRKGLAAYLLIATLLAWTLFLAPLLFGPPGSQAHGTAALAFWSAAMWAPGLAALVTARWIDRKAWPRLGLRRLGARRFYLWAWLVPPALAIVTGILTWALGVGQLDLDFPLIQASMEGAPGAESLPPALIVGGQIAFSLTLAPLINTLFALGEELGWRGYLLPGLLPLGRGRAIVLSGVIWGLWHAPAILQGHNYPGRPVMGVFLMVGFTTLFGAFLSWLYFETGSAWAPALAHGATNATAGLPILFLTGVDLAIGGVLSSVIGWIPLLALTAWLIRSGRLPLGPPIRDPAGERARAATT
jgi:membrane protease YdiL (CAAX protease family)